MKYDCGGFRDLSVRPAGRLCPRICGVRQSVSVGYPVLPKAGIHDFFTASCFRRTDRCVRMRFFFCINKKSPDSLNESGLYIKISRQRPTLPHSCPCSTIGAKELNFRVRDGNGCLLLAIATEKNYQNQIFQCQIRYTHIKTFKIFVSENCGQASRPISTGKLNSLLNLHIRPINLVVFKGSSVCMFPYRGDI